MDRGRPFCKITVHDDVCVSCLQCFDGEPVDLTIGELSAEMVDGFGSILAGMDKPFVRPQRFYSTLFQQTDSVAMN